MNPPSSLRAERATMAALVDSADAWDITRGMLERDDFYDRSMQAAYDAAVFVSGPNRAPDLLAVTERLGVLGQHDACAALLAATGEHPLASSRAVDLAKDLRRLSRRRRVLRAVLELSASGYNAAIDSDEWLRSAEASVFDALQDSSATSGPQRISAVDAVKRYEARALASKGGQRLGLPSTIDGIDDLTQGFGDGHLWIIGGRPGEGKTAFAQQIATAAARRGEPGLIFSLEMPSDELVDRAFASRNLPLSALRSGRLSQWHWDSIMRAAAEVDPWPLYIDDTPGITLAALSSAAKLAVRRWGVRWLVIDYLQLMRSGTRRKGENREQEVSEISKGLKELAKTLRLPIIALSQFNRGTEDRKDRKPNISDFRESGSIEQDADGAILIWRQPTHTTLIIGKNRHGPQGEVRVEFDGPSTSFRQSEDQGEKKEGGFDA